LRILVFVSRDWEIQREVASDIKQAVALTGGSDLDSDGEPDITVVPSRDRDDFDRELPEAEVFFGWSISGERLEAAENLRWIQLASAGVDHIPVKQIVERGILLTNARGVHSVAVAEHAVALLLALARKLPEVVDRQREGCWEPDAVARGQTLLAGKRAAILGFGSIGVEIGRRLAGFGVEIWALVKRPRLVREASRVFGPDDWKEMLGGADFVINCLPETPATRGWLDADRLAACRRGALLVSVGRGATVDEGAIVQSLTDGHLGGAAVDVLETEPLPQDSPLWGTPRLLVTPHVASLTEGMYANVTGLFTENLRRFLTGRELLNVVDPERGY
jgi:phosphoglycerate dehydrogenase-like enzyme